jgi:hypothetical protein
MAAPPSLVMFPPQVAPANDMADMGNVLMVAKRGVDVGSFLQAVKIINTAARQHIFRMAGLF